MQIHLVSEIMQQNIAIILWQFNYDKNSFIVLVPGTRVTRFGDLLNFGQLFKAFGNN